MRLLRLEKCNRDRVGTEKGEVGVGNEVETEDGRFMIELSEFHDDKTTPPYAILSHRWDAEEVLFRDMERGSAKSKRGYQKVEGCCKLAWGHNIKYVWMDTCCIDKTNNVELSEAINSMYRWYYNAEVCYAYLADVEPEPESEGSAEFRNSKWFERGWTLQELIAPSTVIFFDKEWRELGSKEGFGQLVSSRTGIPVDILSGRDNVGSASIAQRMSWAAERETTKPEDRAYSLMGIFGIHMPLLYGEGQRAFVRLQEEIMKVSDDHSIFAWECEVQRHGGLLATSPAAFKKSVDIASGRHHSLAANRAWAVNNKGVNLELSFMGIGHRGLGVAILPCTKPGKDLVAIYLRDVSLTMERFERVHCGKLEAIDLTRFRPAQYPTRPICVPQRRLATYGSAPKDAHSSSDWELFDERTEFVDATARPIPQTGVDTAKAQPADAEVADEDGRTPLSHAAGGGHVEELRSLLARKDIRPDWKDRRGRTPLSHAAENGHAKIVWLLLNQRGARADLKDEDGRTPLSHAAGRGYAEVVWLLLTRSDVQAHSKDSEGRTPLVHAIKRGHEAVVDMFLARDDTRGNFEDDKGRTLLSHASECGQAALVRILLTRSDIKPDTKDNSGRAPLSHAAERGHEVVVQQLLAASQVDIDAKDNSGQTPLSYAAERGHKVVVQQLLATGQVDVDAEDSFGQTPLLYAAGRGYKAVVQQLLATSRINIDAKDNTIWTPLSYAAEKGYEAVVQQLLAISRANVNAKDSFGRMPLLYAAWSGHTAVVQKLLATGQVDVNVKDKFSRTPLSHAAEKGYIAIVRQLLATGQVDVNAKDSFGQTPLLYAARRGYKAVIQQLLATSRINIDAKDNDIRTPLSYAAENGYETIVQQLLATGQVDVNAKDSFGRMPLSYAAENGYETIVQQLLATGQVDVNAKDIFGRILLSYAAERGHTAVVQQLLATSQVDVDAKDSFGQTPLSYAAERGHTAVVQQLQIHSSNRICTVPAKLASESKLAISEQTRRHAESEGKEECQACLLE